MKKCKDTIIVSFLALLTMLAIITLNRVGHMYFIKDIDDEITVSSIYDVEEVEDTTTEYITTTKITTTTTIETSSTTESSTTMASSYINVTKVTTTKVSTSQNTVSTETQTSINSDYVLTFYKNFKKGTAYSPGNWNNWSTTGGSGRKLIDCSVGNGVVKGSIASWNLYSKYGYNRNGKRTMVYLEIKGFESMNGYYYLDDSCARGYNEVIDFYFYSISSCPYRKQGVVNVDCWIVDY